MTDSKLWHIKKGEINNLHFNTDTGDNDEPVAILLFTPNLNEFTHYHIILSKDEANVLHACLEAYLENTLAAMVCACTSELMCERCEFFTSLTSRLQR